MFPNKKTEIQTRNQRPPEEDSPTKRNSLTQTGHQNPNRKPHPRKYSYWEKGRLRLKQVIGNPTERLTPARSLIKNMSVNRKTKTQTGEQKTLTESLTPESSPIKKKSLSRKTKIPNRKTSNRKKTHLEKCSSAGIPKVEQVIRTPTERLPPENPNSKPHPRK